jgi:hypothetical protein
VAHYPAKLLKKEYRYDENSLFLPPQRHRPCPLRGHRHLPLDPVHNCFPQTDPQMDIKMAKTMSVPEISSPDRALSYARADLARALNYAALEAVKTLGEKPVIKLY